MKSLIAAAGIFLGALLVLAQGTSPAQQTIDPAKEADIRALIELTGGKDMVDDAAASAAEQFRAKFQQTLPDNDRAQKFTEAFLERYKARFNSDELLEQIVRIYDKHFSAEDVKELLKFYGSPLGQRVAEAMPQIARESQAAGQALSQRVSRDVHQELKNEFPELMPARRPRERRQ